MKPRSPDLRSTTSVSSTSSSPHDKRHPSSPPSSSSQDDLPSPTPSPTPSPSPSPSTSFTPVDHSSSLSLERRGPHSAVCRWHIPSFPRARARALWSRYFDVGGFDCRLLLYPRGDAQALPGYLSLYLQISDPRSPRWDCFASYRLSILHPLDDSKSLHRDSWHRFSSKKKSHGWCDFAPSAPLLSSHFLSPSPPDSLLVQADLLLLDELVSFSPDALGGKFTWKVRNFPIFRDMIRTQKIMSPVFPAGDCSLRISVYQSVVSGVEHLSMCLESKDSTIPSTSTSNTSSSSSSSSSSCSSSSCSSSSSSSASSNCPSDRSCWCIFRMTVLGQLPAANHVHRDSYGRFAADGKAGDNTSLGWNDFMRMSDFLGPDSGYLADELAAFSVSFHVIKEWSGFSKNAVGFAGGRGGSGSGGARKSDSHLGKFTWRIDNFTKLKDLLKKRKITGLCIKSKRFHVGNRDCRLIVYPRGQSQPPCHLSVFLEVTDSRSTSNDWSCFVSHRLSVVNQRNEERSVTKESQNRYSRSAKDWGWREFITLTSLFDQDSGFLVQDTVVFSAEVLILKETCTIQEFTNQLPEPCNSVSGPQAEVVAKRGSFTWRVENFSSFKEIMETRKIFSKFFQAGGCELRIGVYESFDTICIYLESDQSSGSDPEKNFWVRYRMAVINQKNPSKTVWKESSICTKTWNNSVLQFMKVADLLEVEGGFLARDSVVFVCEIVDCCPWFEFCDLEVLASEDEQDALSTDPDELVNSDDSEGISGDEEDMFRNLLSRAGFHLTYGDNPSQPQVTLREKLLMDAGAIAGFLSGLRVYLDDPVKVKRLLLPAKLSGNSNGKKVVPRGDSNSPSLMNLLMGVKVLQQAIIDLLLDIMVECCQPSDESINDLSEDSPRDFLKKGPFTFDTSQDIQRSEDGECSVDQRLDSGAVESCSGNMEQCFAHNSNGSCEKDNSGNLAFPPETSASNLYADDESTRSSKTKWPEQSEELLGLIVNSLRTLDSAVPQGCPEPRRRPQSVQKLSLLLEKAPKHLQSDLVSLVPKLVDRSEHHLGACMLLDHLQRPAIDPAIRLPVFGALNQLELGSEVWEQILIQTFNLLTDSNDEQLVEAVTFVFKAASQCQHLPRAVRTVRSKLKTLGMDIPHGVLDILSKTVNSWADVAEAVLSDIDSDCELDESCPTVASQLFTSDGVPSVEEQVMHGCYHISDMYILVDMLLNPSLFDEVSQVFERAISRGTITLQLLAMVLDRRHSHHLNTVPNLSTANIQIKEPLVEEKPGSLKVQEDDFTSILALGEALSLSREPRVQDFVRMLYAIMFKIYADEHYRARMLKGLVDRITSSSDNCRLVDIDLDVLTFLVREEDGVARLVLNMMREIVELAHVDRAALWHQVCAFEDEVFRTREERQVESSNFADEKAALSQNLSESETTINRLKNDLKCEIDRFAREKKDLSGQISEVESQLEWVRSEKDDKIAKLSTEKKVLQERLHDTEAQISQLKSRKRDELKKIVKEKNALAERLKNSEAARKRFDDELKRYANENLSREEVRQSLEDEVRRLTQTVGQTETERREKEEQVARCEAYIDRVQAQLHACQEYIQSLEASFKDEMSRHAPLYGAGLENLSMSELETLARIHEEGLRNVHAFQQLKGGSGGQLVSGHPLPHSHGLFTTAPVAVGPPPPSFIPNGDGLHGNGLPNGTASSGPWFSPS